MNFIIAGNNLVNDGNAITNFVPRIRGLYSANPEEPLRLLLEVTREGAPPQTIVRPAEQLDQLNFEKLIVGCISRDARGRSTRNLVATYLRMQLAQCDLPHGQCFNQTGWQQIDGQHRYLPDPVSENRLAALPSSGPPPYLITEGASICRLSVDPTLSDATAGEQLIRTFEQHPDIYLPVWGYSLFSVCRSFLQDSGLPTACILYMIATQGFGKTATAKALCQLFDDSSGYIADVYDAGSTMSAMERALMTTRDRSVLLDDIYIGTNKAKQRERLASAAALLRFVANETKRTNLHWQTAVCSPPSGSAIVFAALSSGTVSRKSVFTICATPVQRCCCTRAIPCRKFKCISVTRPFRRHCVMHIWMRPRKSRHRTAWSICLEIVKIMRTSRIRCRTENARVLNGSSVYSIKCYRLMLQNLTDCNCKI